MIIIITNDTVNADPPDPNDVFTVVMMSDIHLDHASSVSQNTFNDTLVDIDALEASGTIETDMILILGDIALDWNYWQHYEQFTNCFNSTGRWREEFYLIMVG